MPADRCPSCQAAAIPHWHPHQLRHTKATEIRRAFGLDLNSQTLTIVTDVFGYRRREAEQRAAELLEELDRCRRRFLELGLPPTRPQIDRAAWEWEFRDTLDSILEACKRQLHDVISLTPPATSDPLP